MANRFPKTILASGQSACIDGLLRPFPEGAAFLGIGRSKIFALMSDGTIPIVRVFDGGPRRIPKAALVTYLDRRVIKRGS